MERKIRAIDSSNNNDDGDGDHDDDDDDDRSELTPSFETRKAKDMKEKVPIYYDENDVYYNGDILEKGKLPSWLIKEDLERIKGQDRVVIDPLRILLPRRDDDHGQPEAPSSFETTEDVHESEIKAQIYYDDNDIYYNGDILEAGKLPSWSTIEALKRSKGQDRVIIDPLGLLHLINHETDRRRRRD